jgi:hypothetical protein
MIDAFESSSFETYFLPTPDVLASEAIKQAYEHMTENDRYVAPKKTDNVYTIIDKFFGLGFSFMLSTDSHL